MNCVTLYRWSHDVVIEDNHFHDCLGCDFVNGRFGSDLVIRDNRFERALPCRMGPYRCGHKDLVQLFGGRRLLVARNHFGVYREGGAQLYLTNTVDYATIVNNVFVGTDPRVPGYRARMGIVIGSNASQRMPLYAKVVNNTILTGERRRDGYAGSIRMSTRYGAVPAVAAADRREQRDRPPRDGRPRLRPLAAVHREPRDPGQPVLAARRRRPARARPPRPAGPDLAGDRRSEQALRPSRGTQPAAAAPGGGPTSARSSTTRAAEQLRRGDPSRPGARRDVSGRAGSSSSARSGRPSCRSPRPAGQRCGSGCRPRRGRR